MTRSSLLTLLLGTILTLGTAAAADIPSTLSTGIFDVTLNLDKDWRAAVFKERALIHYQYGNRADRQGTVAEIIVRLIPLPGEKDAETTAKEWIKQDPQKIMEEFFGGRVRPRAKRKWQVANPFIAEMHGFEIKPAFEGKGPYRFGQIALLFPANFAEQRVAFLLLGHEINSSPAQLPEQFHHLDEIIASLAPPGASQ